MENQAMCKDYEARRTYELFVLSQPHIKCNGLFKTTTGTYLIHCPEVTEDSLSMDGLYLFDWLMKHKVIVSLIDVTAELPLGCEEVQPRSVKEIIELTGISLKHLSTFYQYRRYLGKDFPFSYANSIISYDRAITAEGSYLRVDLSRKLSPDEKKHLEESVQRHGLPVDFEVYSLDRNTPDFKYDGSALNLLPASKIPSGASKRIKVVYEEDEEYWTDNVFKLFSTEISDTQSVIDKPIPNSCIIDGSASPSVSFRSLYTIYDHIYLAFPSEISILDFMSSIQLPIKEIESLLENGHLTIILPQSFHRYENKELDRFLDASMNTPIGPRRLAALSMIVTKQRIPFLYNGLSIDEKAMILRVLYDMANHTHGPEASIVHQFISSLSRMWQSAEQLIQLRGSMGTTALGLGSFYADFIKLAKGIDIWLELSSASQCLEWGIGLQADMIPIQDSEYDEYQNAMVLAALYTGFGQYPVVTAAEKSDIIVEGVLGVNNDMPIMNLLDSIGSADKMRWKELVKRRQSGDISSDELTQQIREFNKEIRRLESRIDKQSKMDIGGLLVASAGPVGAILAATPSEIPSSVGIGIASVALMPWVFEQLNHRRSESKIIGTIIDGLQGGINRTSRDAAFVSRVRRNIK